MLLAPKRLQSHVPPSHTPPPSSPTSCCSDSENPPKPTFSIYLFFCYDSICSFAASTADMLLPPSVDLPHQMLSASILVNSFQPFFPRPLFSNSLVFSSSHTLKKICHAKTQKGTLLRCCRLLASATLQPSSWIKIRFNFADFYFAPDARLE